MPYRAQWTPLGGKRVSAESPCEYTLLVLIGGADAAWFRHDPRYGRDALNADKWIPITPPIRNDDQMSNIPPLQEEDAA